jgi:hypothetical protein
VALPTTNPNANNIVAIASPINLFNMVLLKKFWILNTAKLGFSQRSALLISSTAAKILLNLLPIFLTAVRARVMSWDKTEK